MNEVVSVEAIFAVELSVSLLFVGCCVFRDNPKYLSYIVKPAHLFVRDIRLNIISVDQHTNMVTGAEPKLETRL